MAVHTEPLMNQADLLQRGLADLWAQDAELAGILDAEVARQHQVLSLVSSSCAVRPMTLAASASALVNVTAEGLPGRRYGGGCENVDLVEALAIRRARELFDAQYASVQSHSASNANYHVLTALLEPGDTLLGMGVKYGGHHTHGSSTSFAGIYYKAIRYGTTSAGVIDYDQVRKLALAHRPRIIMCGATAYSRVIDFQRFREIADEAGAILLADISHIAGLVATGRHPSPIDVAHVTTTCTHKQLMGPRGGLILSGQAANTKVPGLRTTFSRALDQAVYPRMQGAPAVNMIAAKAAALAYAKSTEFDRSMGRIRSTADEFASAFQAHDYEVVGGGSENHTVLIRLRGGITGAIAESALERCAIIVDKYRVPGETRPSLITSGLRIGTGSIAQRRIDPQGCRQIVDLICRILDSVRPISEQDYLLEPALREQFRLQTEAFCTAHPIAEYV
ncbi:glycine hydroxymethyltransferase [Pseudomonas sp. LAMO17WK12:I6]|jgi:glycine hydroxymethyltransferase|uniref:Serine hydroxymethyltransferase n=1 Tax=Pseudomonas jessenii TaxID=77298 RepID=A0A5C4L1A7_PSEJE|nr:MULTISPECIES: serine hydroxymethyltransferase [Pseudomonas]QBR30947.1 serine hydroxymethyltransferase [Pseudomonas sp. S150]TNB98016.1 serine hydroxymethyltransferase [Pseudomonas jessenii]UZT94460.1 serine hydroxymethyltransferase [Pseudomonas koreensis]SNY40646.1 glycine hydroxymethyltransferase [Pseudomonas sp. LAMO17WK12:I5]SNY44522.1 glycine hydroxymethyltransferase [Pseudomonas sp. LAMO17WK12:I6]